MMVIGMLAIACSGGRLTSTKALEVVNTDVADKDVQLSVTGISQDGSSPQAVAKVTTSGIELRLGFRRYDTGWKWETAELPDNRQISAKDAIEQLRDVARLARAKTWAAPLVDKYRTTAETMSWLLGNMNRKTSEPADAATWDVRYQLDLSILRSQAPKDPKRRDLLRRLDPPTDEWGHPIKWVINSGERSAYIVSFGPDGLVGTKDDLICQLVGHKNWDDFYKEIMWDYTAQWRLPEGLSDAVVDYLPPKRKDAQVTYVRFIE